jgi:hypothetical protein
MNSDNIIKDLSANSKIFLPFDELDNILSFSKIILEQNTLISDFIRILAIDNLIVVQEKTNKNEILLHHFKDEAKARDFVNERLDTYERMWDGCGCKVNYYD